MALSTELEQLLDQYSKELAEAEKQSLEKKLGKKAKELRIRSPRSGWAQAYGKEVLSYLYRLTDECNNNVENSTANYRNKKNRENFEQKKHDEDRRESLFKGMNKLWGDLPVMFGTESKYRRDNFRDHNPQIPPYEFDPNIKGFIAEMHLTGCTEINDYIRNTLLVGNKKGNVPEDAAAYSVSTGLVMPGCNKVYRKTILTETDGIVWYEETDRKGNPVPHSQRLIMFPQESLVSPSARNGDYTI